MHTRAATPTPFLISISILSAHLFSIIQCSIPQLPFKYWSKVLYICLYSLKMHSSTFFNAFSNILLKKVTSILKGK